MNLFVEIDLSQAEWCVTAYASRDIRMIEIIEKGKDPHLETGHLISNAPREFIILEDTHIGHLTNPDDIAQIRAELKVDWPNISQWFLPRVMSIRQAGKKSNHGLNYNMRYKRFSLENEMPEGDGKRIVDLYHKAYPSLEHVYYPWISHQLKRDRTLTDCFENKRTFRKAWNHDLLAAAYAWLPQSTVGEIGKRGVRATYEDTHPDMKDVHIVANVHDSINTLIRFNGLEHLYSICQRLREHMTQTCCYHNRTFKIRTDVKMGINWGSMHAVNLDVKDPFEELREVLEVVRAEVQ
jgi:DNA polymerase I-like protein with 3'-5' exonuclease and polymerase domains